MFTRQGLAVGAGDRAGAGAALGFNQAKPWPWVQVLNQASPRLWPGLRLELALVFTRQGPGCRRWRSTGLQPGKALAMGSGAQPGKPQAVTRPALGAGTGVHPAKPWQWWPVIELVQAQHWALTRQSPSPGYWCSTRASPGRGPACAWSWHRCRCWCSTRQGPGPGCRC